MAELEASDVTTIFCGHREVFRAGSAGPGSESLVHDSSGRFTASLGDCLVTVVTRWGVHEYYSWHSDVTAGGEQLWYVIEPSGALAVVSEDMHPGRTQRGTLRAYAPGAWVSVEGWRADDPHHAFNEGVEQRPAT